MSDRLPVVILCGGQGQRMKGSTSTKKELVEIGGRPILWHVMRIYATYDQTRFILTLGHQAEDIKRYFLEYKPMSYDFTVRLGQPDATTFHERQPMQDWEITLADTGLDTMKGSRIYRIRDYIDTDTFFVTYGDGVGDIDVDELLAFHRQHGRLATVTGVHPHSQYGVLQVTEQGQIERFGEKPELDHWINAGFMVLEREVLSYLGASKNVDLETEVLPQLAAEGELMMYRHSGFWRSMDTFKEALELDGIWERSAPWKVWE